MMISERAYSRFGIQCANQRVNFRQGPSNVLRLRRQWRFLIANARFAVSVGAIYPVSACALKWADRYSTLSL